MSAWWYWYLAQRNEEPKYSLTLSLATTCLLHFKMPAFVLKALQASVPRPLFSHAHSQCFLHCHKWSLYSLLYLSAVMTVLTPIRTSVTPYLASQNEKLSLQGVPHIDPFQCNNFPSLFPLFCLHEKYLFIFTYFFIFCFFLSYIFLLLLYIEPNGPTKMRWWWKAVCGYLAGPNRGAGMWAYQGGYASCRMPGPWTAATPVQHSRFMS